MTQTTILPTGDKGVLLSPEHRLLRKLFDYTGPTYYPAQQGASVTQLRALERKRLAALVRNGTEVLGAHLTARGEQRLIELDAAQARAELIARRAAGDLS